ncbi:MAG: glycosyltransferase [Phycisphaeraceae bacterium]|nr:MAG: glycosyltransferase [Phycisphaeraceae bacterium]
MRILHVISSLDPKQGGPPMIAARIGAAQASLGHRVGMLYHSDPGADDRLAKAVASIPGFDAVTLHRLDYPGSNLGELLRSPAKEWLKTGLKDYDWLHLHGIWHPILPKAAAAARTQRVPYALVPHGMLDPWSLRGQGTLKYLKKRLALAMGYRRMIEGAAYFHLGNRDEERLIKPLGLSPPVEIIPNGVFPQEIDNLPATGRFLAKHPHLAGKRFVLFLSRLHFKKGLDFLADAFADVAPKHPDTDLVVAGPDDGMRAPMTEQLRRRGVLDRVHFTGPLWGDDKLAALVDCWCFCLPSRQEGFSMAITEALGCRKPVVISEGCHFPEVGEVGAGWVTPVGARETADALHAVLAMSPADARSMGERGRALVLERFTWPTIAKATLEGYARHTPTDVRRPA